MNFATYMDSDFSMPYRPPGQVHDRNGETIPKWQRFEYVEPFPIWKCNQTEILAMF